MPVKDSRSPSFVGPSVRFCRNSAVAALVFWSLAAFPLLGFSGGGIGPDVIVGDLNGVTNWGVSDGIRAYSVGTTSCNIGDANLEWDANTNRHPVIAQNLYRLHDGRFEQIGQSWLKHGFFALSEDLCFDDCQPTDGNALGVHCSDPYTSGLNGSRSGLGPRSEVNPTTGDFPYPPTRPFSDAIIGRRLQVDENDVNPAFFPGARYFVEGHYITPDDAQAGNGLNNASYREAVLSGEFRDLVLVGETRQGFPALYAWAEADPSVKTYVLDVSGDGRFHIFSRASGLGNGFWRYEYAVHNLNSARCAGGLRIPFPEGATVANIEFKDVDSHSGEPYSNQDWTPTLHGDAVSWDTETHGLNPDANALRWGTSYNFRFDCDRAPNAFVTADLTLFQPGTPDYCPIEVVAPGEVVALEDALAGNVESNLGSPVDVVFVNGSSGGTDRRIDIQKGESVELTIQVPPNGPASTCFVLYVYPELPSSSTIRHHPFGIGAAAMPTPLSGLEVPPLRIANSFPKRFDAQLGSDQWFHGGRTGKAPRTLLQLPAGMDRSTSVFLQGFIFDRNSPHGQLGITNGLTVTVP